MRSVIACNRKAKVKCKHSGQAPCQGCRKSENVETCLLTGPDIAPKGSHSPRLHTLKRKRASVVPPIIGDGIRQAFNQISREHFLRAAALFQSQFPEFAFLHPSDLDYNASHLSDNQMLRLMAMLAVSHHSFDDSATELSYTVTVTNELHKRLTSPPSLCLVHAFLILALCNWGDGDGFSAWMHTGVASRMAQGLLSSKLSQLGKESISEAEKRTLWSCFVMDKLLSCGKRRQAMFDLHTMQLPLPSHDDSFVFDDMNKQVPISSQQPNPPANGYDLDASFLLIVKGLHIWSQIYSWTAEGGRRQPGMTELDQCPWRESSKWHTMKRELEEWRDSQNTRIMYPESRVSSHAHLKQAEKFGHINLIYYVSLLLLCREYIPFLPVGETKPRGPIERPLLKAKGPDSFWTQNLKDLFHAATQISNILRDLRRVGASLRTPFAGLCAFSAFILNHYAASFPSFMEFTPDQVEQAAAQAKENMHDLCEIGRVWKIAEDWTEVANTVKSLLDRAAETNSGLAKKSRYDYPDLEDSINLAQLKGLPKPTYSRPASNPPAGNVEDSTSTPERTGAGEADGSLRPPQASDEGTWNIANEAMDEDEWRLWSFWDDPHLLSTVIDPNLNFEAYGDI